MSVHHTVPTRFQETRYLVLNDHIIDKVVSAKLTLGEVTKHPQNPLFGEDKPWEPRFDNVYANVIYDSMEEAEFASSGRASLTLARGDELTLILVVMKAGTTLDEHSAPAAAAVITLGGKIIFTSSADKITLEQGEGVTFTGDVVHSVHASEDSTFLIVIGGKVSH